MLSLKHPFYRNPFYLAHTQTGRVDMGVDYHGVGTICAIGRARIVGDGGRGWPGGHYLCYKLLLGRHRGRYVYVAEGVLPIVKPGQMAIIADAPLGADTAGLAVGPFMLVPGPND